MMQHPSEINLAGLEDTGSSMQKVKSKVSKIILYILRLNNNTHYTGITKNLVRRMIEHNTGQSKSTRRHLPITLIHTESFESRKEARRKEVYIKNMGAKRYLNKLRFS